MKIEAGKVYRLVDCANGSANGKAVVAVAQDQAGGWWHCRYEHNGADCYVDSKHLGDATDWRSRALDAEHRLTESSGCQACGDPTPWLDARCLCRRTVDEKLIASAARVAELEALLGEASAIMGSNWTISHRAARELLARIDAALAEAK